MFLVAVAVALALQLGSASARAAESGDPVGGAPASYRFEAVDTSGRPAHWDYCTPITYYVNPDLLPPGAETDIDEAFARLSAATGLQFIYAGTTKAIPFADGRSIPSDVPNSITVAWADEVMSPVLAGSVVAHGGLNYVFTDRGWRATNGAVVVDTEFALAAGFEGGASRGAVLLHELGHVMNLGHVDDPSQLMTSGVISTDGAFRPATRLA